MAFAVVLRVLVWLVAVMGVLLEPVLWVPVWLVVPVLVVPAALVPERVPVVSDQAVCVIRFSFTCRFQLLFAPRRLSKRDAARSGMTLG